MCVIDVEGGTHYQRKKSCGEGRGQGRGGWGQKQGRARSCGVVSLQEEINQLEAVRTPGNKGNRMP